MEWAGRRFHEIGPHRVGVATGEVSVNPHPCVITQPVVFFSAPATTPWSAMPPRRILEGTKSTASKPGVLSNPLNSVLTPLMKLNLYSDSATRRENRADCDEYVLRSEGQEPGNWSSARK